MEDSVKELGVICAILGEWEKRTCCPCGLTMIDWNQSQTSVQGVTATKFHKIILGRHLREGVKILQCVMERVHL
jgi:hypothetical protein